ncbi:MAG: hypothetical protein KDM63_05045 [Verrucomicrobiae bacterium]|nr:hypothetical protein [Verrucomicrobiae bacterium]
MKTIAFSNCTPASKSLRNPALGRLLSAGIALLFCTMPAFLDAGYFNEETRAGWANFIATERVKTRIRFGEEAAKIFESVMTQQMRAYDDMIWTYYEKFFNEQYLPRIRPHIYCYVRVQVMVNKGIDPNTWQKQSPAIKAKVDKVVDSIFAMDWHRNYRLNLWNNEFWIRNPDFYWRNATPIYPDEALNRALGIANAAVNAYNANKKVAQWNAVVQKAISDQLQQQEKQEKQAMNTMQAKQLQSTLQKENAEKIQKDRIFGQVPALSTATSTSTSQYNKVSDFAPPGAAVKKTSDKSKNGVLDQSTVDQYQKAISAAQW